MSLAAKIRLRRTEAGLTLDALATEADISKTYLWELENDRKKPSADVLLRIAKALSTTMADLLDLPAVTIDDQKVEVPPSLLEFQQLMAQQKKPLSDQDIRELAPMQFRGGRPRTVEDWQALYLMLLRMTGRNR